jgi:hypothetical protein
MTEMMGANSATVSSLSQTGGYAPFELIESAELAARWRVPESWIRNRTRARTPKEERIPCVRLGRYVRFDWRSPELHKWLDKMRQI